MAAKMQTPSCDSAIVQALIRAQGSEQVNSVKILATSINEWDRQPLKERQTAEVIQRTYNEVSKFVTPAEANSLNRNCSLTEAP